MAKISSYPHTVPTTSDSILISKSSNKTTRSTTVGDVIDLIETGLLPGVGTVTSIGVTAPSAFTVTNSPVTSTGTIAITGSGTASQYIDGTGSLQDFDRDSTSNTLGYKIIPSDFDFSNIPSSYSNSIWEIRNHHDLDGNLITLPIGVVLKNEGGSLSNGTLTGVNTTIEGSSMLFKTSLIVNGTWDSDSGLKPAWFELESDDTNRLQKVFDMSDNDFTVDLQGATFILKSTILLNRNKVVTINGNGATLTTTSGNNGLLFMNISSGTVNCNGVLFDGAQIGQRGVYVTEANVNFYENIFINFYTLTLSAIGIFIDYSIQTDKVATIRNNKITEMYGVTTGGIGDSLGSTRAILVTSPTSASGNCKVVIQDNYFNNIFGREGDVLQFTDHLPDDSESNSRVIVQGNYIGYSNRRGIKVQGNNVTVKNNTFKTIDKNHPMWGLDGQGGAGVFSAFPMTPQTQSNNCIFIDNEVHNNGGLKGSIFYNNSNYGIVKGNVIYNNVIVSASNNFFETQNTCNNIVVTSNSVHTVGNIKLSTDTTNISITHNSFYNIITRAIMDSVTTTPSNLNFSYNTIYWGNNPLDNIAVFHVTGTSLVFDKAIISRNNIISPVAETGFNRCSLMYTSGTSLSGITFFSNVNTDSRNYNFGTTNVDGCIFLSGPNNQSLDTTSDVTFNSISGDGSGLTNIDKYSTSYIDTNIYTKTEANSLFTSGFVGAITPTSAAPTQDGLYSCSTSGTYTNFGGEVVSLNNQVVSIAVENNQTTFTQLVTLTGITFDSTPTFGSTNAVKSGGVKLDLLTKANTEIGKNKYNYEDSSNLTQSYFSNSSGNIATGNANTMITHYIKVSNGDTLYSDNMFGSSAFHELTDIFAQNPTYIAAVSGKTFTATQDGFVRISLNISLANSTTTQIELGTSATAIVPFSTTILDSEIPLNIPRFSVGTTIDDYSKLVEGKNIFNYNDSSNITPGYFKNTSGGIGTGNVNLLITHYIPVSNGQKIYSHNLLDSSNTYHELTDTNKLNPTYISATGLKVFTATQDGFVRLSLNKGSIIQFSDIMVEYGIKATQFQPYLKVVNKLLLPQPVFDHRLVNTITCKRYGTSGVDADFCGLNAVGDALNSITDASATNRYKIKVEGVFLFTLQTEFAYNEPRADQPTIIIGKNWVDIEGLGKEKTVIAVELDPSQTFTGGKTYFDFQPVAWNCNSNLSNMAIIGKNCRYSIHIESADLANDAIMNFNHLYIDFKGATAMGGGGGNAIGTGMRKGQVWNFNNCYIRSAGNPFGLHTALQVLEKGGEVNLKNCNLIGDNLSLEMFPNNQIINFTLENCDFSKSLQIKYRYSYDDGSVLADYSDIKINSTSKALLVDNSDADKGQGLRIKSKSTGVNSTVSFDETSTALDVIIGDSTKLVEVSNNQLNKSQYGYQWKDGGVGLSGYAIGSIDIDENNTSKTNGLGVLLGDCSTSSKTLTVVIDSVSYNIVFNENFTSQNNAYVIGKITDIIGTVADVDAFYVGQEYYPKFSETQEMENGDTTAIISGMGVVFISSTEMRIAINSDNRIDGICLYDTAVGEKGIVIEKGNIWAMNKGYRFSTLETSNTGRNKGDELGISPTQDGYFELSASPSLLRAFEFNSLEIL